VSGSRSLKKYSSRPHFAGLQLEAHICLSIIQSEAVNDIARNIGGHYNIKYKTIGPITKIWRQLN